MTAGQPDLFGEAEGRTGDAAQGQAAPREDADPTAPPPHVATVRGTTAGRRSSRAARAGVDAAPVRADTRALADALPSALRLGTSSWTFPGWAGIVYDRTASQTVLSRDGLAAYARHPLLRAVGLDRTFYAPIDAETFARYAAQVPPDFRFLVKAHAAITSPSGRLAERGPDGRRRFLDASYAAEMVLSPAAEGLGQRLGVVLFQFPPLSLATHRWAGFVRALADFLAALPRGAPVAVEVRDAPLVTDAALARDLAHALADAGAVHCPTVHPTMPSVIAQTEALGEDAYRGALVPVRWMLQADRTYEEARDAFAPFDRLQAPDPVVRGEVAEVVRSLLAAGREVIVIANNKAEGSAPRTLEALGHALTSGTSPRSARCTP